MAGVFESYEQQFSTITADITARINKIPNQVGSKFHRVDWFKIEGWLFNINYNTCIVFNLGTS